MSGTSEIDPARETFVERLRKDPVVRRSYEEWRAGRDAIQDGVVYVDPGTGMHMGPEFARRLYDDPKLFEARERMLKEEITEGRDPGGSAAMELRDHAIAKALRRAFNPEPVDDPAPPIPRDVQAAKRATLPPPPKHGRQRAPVDREAFSAKRDAKRKMRKASRRAQR